MIKEVVSITISHVINYFFRSLFIKNIIMQGGDGDCDIIKSTEKFLGKDCISECVLAGGERERENQSDQTTTVQVNSEQIDRCNLMVVPMLKKKCLGFSRLNRYRKLVTMNENDVISICTN